MTFQELCTKEVIQMQAGICLGKTDDLVIDIENALVQKLVLFGRPKLFGLLGREEDLVIPWNDVRKIGMDAILVSTDIPKRERPKPFWERRMEKKPEKTKE